MGASTPPDDGGGGVTVRDTVVVCVRVGGVTTLVRVTTLLGVGVRPPGVGVTGTPSGGPSAPVVGDGVTVAVRVRPGRVRPGCGTIPGGTYGPQ